MPGSGILDYSDLLLGLRQNFGSGKTKQYEYRLQQLQQMDRLIAENIETIYSVLLQDLRKCRVESDFMEVLQVQIELAHAIQELKSWMKPERVPADLINVVNTCEIRREPLGVVLIIGAWNYPIQLLLGPVVGAIAAGNCVVMKPSELSANTANLLEELVPKYLDQDCFRLINGGIPESTALLKERWDHILYTGNPVVAKIVMKAAAEHLTPVTLELGGKCPTVVDRGCDMDVVAQRVTWAKFANAGQTCLACDYVLCMRDCVDMFIDSMKKAITKFYSANPQTSDSYGRIVNARHFARVTALIERSKVVIGGDVDERDLYIAPTVMKNVHPSDKVMQEEIFGPVLPVVAVDTIEEAIAFVCQREKPLAAYIFSNNQCNIEKFSGGTSSGALVVNDAVVHAGVGSLPFGGVGNSGIGAYHGKFSFDTFSHKKATLIKNQLMESLNCVRYPPYDKDWVPLRVVRWLIKPTASPKKAFSFVSSTTVLSLAFVAVGYVGKMYEDTLRSYLNL